ncbi:EAL domain-containing protein [Alteromonas macleodii]|uniref:PAS domain S-box/diguanylate cyclase (GGDEF) domain-containing protein n=1 Tax=Alteromonas macleodii TaxID=28108 RepID=A0A6T9Y3D8_ALTMA|nr:EAL domain-containing protein [Alteromonas macleodii]CAB9495265.1 PAS domain S-box/diguanylate cyclase (GGDEF) domain-containing protein [Alteromonas macleodii]
MSQLFQTLQVRVIILISMIAIPGFIGISYDAYVEREQAIKAAVSQAVNTTKTHSKIQANLIEETRHFLKNLAQFDAVQQPSTEQCSRFLANVLKVNSNYVNLGVPRADGELLCNARKLKRSVNVYDRPYIQQAIATRKFSISEFQIDRATNLTSINFAYPVINPNQGNLVGLVVAVISLNWWNEILSESYLPDNTVAFITDSENKILAAFPVRQELLGTLLEIEGKEKENKSEYTNTSLDNTVFLSEDPYQRVYVTHPLFDDGQHINITIGIPLKHTFEAIDTRLMTTTLILALIVLFFVGVSVWLIRKNVLIPIKTLLKSTTALAEGKEVDETSTKGSIELRKLQLRFAQMARTRLDAEKQLIDSQNSLQESRDILASHIENTPLGCVTWDTDFICTDWNKSAELIFGYSKEEAIGKHASELVVPIELRHEINDVFEILVEGKKTVRRVNDNLTRLLETITCEWYSTPILDFSGKVISVVSLVQDITVNKRLEDKLKLSASVFSHAREGIFITDSESNIIDVNKTFEEITGYSRSEVLGNKPSMFKSGKQSKEFYENLWKSIINDGYWAGEVWNKRKNHEIYAQLLTVSAVKDDDGTVKNYIAIFSDISETKEQQYRLEQMAHYDILTNLPNRTLLAERLDSALRQCQTDKRYAAVALLDLDGFKEINDTFGHSVGDELLITLAHRFKSTLNQGDTISRFGGDEFVAVLTNLKQAQDFRSTVKNMLKAASTPVKYGENELKVSASIGLTVYPTDDTDAEQLIRHADQAMYLAKQKGKNCFHLFDIESEDAIKTRHETVKNIGSALKNNEFELYYQPKVNMRTGEIVGAEALIRWQHSTRGLLSPAEFLPFIENHPLSIDVGEWVIEQSLRQYHQWKQLGIDIKISVNISALQIQQRNFPTRLEHLLSKVPETPPKAIQLEVLETSKLSNIKKVSEIMEDCVNLGVTFAIDDFGTGYSSLTYLRRLPAEVIKIDQSFVRDMLVDLEDKTIVTGVIALANSFNRSVIAEGVESVAHGASLLALGCELAQGFGIARPMPSKALPTWVEQWETREEWK